MLNIETKFYGVCLIVCVLILQFYFNHLKVMLLIENNAKLRADLVIVQAENISTILQESLYHNKKQDLLNRIIEQQELITTYVHEFNTTLHVNDETKLSILRNLNVQYAIINQLVIAGYDTNNCLLNYQQTLLELVKTIDSTENVEDMKPFWESLSNNIIEKNKVLTLLNKQSRT